MTVKLVRDKIPDLITSSGRNAPHHVATKEEYHQKLREKLLEECYEFLETENQEELVDILEVVEAFRDYLGFNETEVKAFKNKKAQDCGRFIKRIILDK